jgi:hypothetical protein
MGTDQKSTYVYIDLYLGRNIFKSRYFAKRMSPDQSIGYYCLRRSCPHKRPSVDNHQNFISLLQSQIKDIPTSKGPFFWLRALIFVQKSWKRPSTSPTTKLQKEKAFFSHFQVIYSGKGPCKLIPWLISPPKLINIL